MTKIDDILANLPFIQKLPKEYQKLIASQSSMVHFENGKRILRAQEKADTFYFIISGKVAVEIFTHKRGAITLQTLGKGEMIGWSWLIFPYLWHFDVRAIKETEVIAVDGIFLRQKCEQDDKLHCMLLQWITNTMAQRLKVTRLQLLDIYGENL